VSGGAPERDPVPDELRELYRRLRPPLPPDSAADGDPQTARAVRWMQEAWHGLAIPPARAPAVRRREWRAAWLLRVAAAAAVLGASAAGWRALQRAPSHAPAETVVQGPAPDGAGGVEVVVAAADRLELRSGTVRLVLLDPPSTSTRTETNETPTGG
jgi:hypothetical protein